MLYTYILYPLPGFVGNLVLQRLSIIFELEVINERILATWECKQVQQKGRKTKLLQLHGKNITLQIQKEIGGDPLP